MELGLDIYKLHCSFCLYSRGLDTWRICTHNGKMVPQWDALVLCSDASFMFAFPPNKLITWKNHLWFWSCKGSQEPESSKNEIQKQKWLQNVILNHFWFNKPFWFLSFLKPFVRGSKRNSLLNHQKWFKEIWSDKKVLCRTKNGSTSYFWNHF